MIDKKLIDGLILNGQPSKDVAAAGSCSISTVRNRKRVLRKQGRLEAHTPPTKKPVIIPDLPENGTINYLKQLREGFPRKKYKNEGIGEAMSVIEITIQASCGNCVYCKRIMGSDNKYCSKMGHSYSLDNPICKYWRPSVRSVEVWITRKRHGIREYKK